MWGGILEEGIDAFDVEGLDFAVFFENGSEPFEDLGVEVVLVEHVLDQTLMTQHGIYVFLLQFIHFDLVVLNFPEFLDGFEFGLEGGGFFQALYAEIDILFLYCIIFLLLFDEKGIEGEDFHVVFEFIVGY